MAARVGKSILSVLQLMSANVAVKAVGLVMVAFYARYLTKVELSLIPIYTMVGSFAVVFFGFGLRPTLLRMLPSRLKTDPDEAQALISTSSLILMLGAAAFSVLNLVLAPWMSRWLFESDETVGLMRIIAIGAFFVAARDVGYYLLWTDSRFHRISAVQTTGALSRALLGGSFVILWGVTGLAIALVTVDAICTLLSLWFLRDIVFIRQRRWYPAWKLLKMSAPFYLESFLVYFRNKGDNWIIAGALGPSAIATYFIAKRLPQLLTMLRGSVDNVLTAQVAKKASQPDEITRYIPRLYELISHTMMPAIAIAAGIAPTFVTLVAGPEYTSAVIPCILLCLAQLAQLYVAPVGRALFVTREPIVRVISTTGESVLLLTLLIFLAPRWYENGVALSLFLTGIGAYFLAAWLLRRKLAFEFPTRRFFSSLVASALLMGCLLAAQYAGWGLLMIAAAGAVGLLLFLLFVSMTNSVNFYGTLNSVSPIALVDPVRWLAGRHGPNDA